MAAFRKICPVSEVSPLCLSPLTKLQWVPDVHGTTPHLSYDKGTWKNTAEAHICSWMLLLLALLSWKNPSSSPTPWLFLGSKVVPVPTLKDGHQDSVS